MKRTLLLSLLAAMLILTGCSSQTTEVTPAEPIRIACVGDSVTYGFGLDRSDTYPSRLAEQLGSGYLVENFGVNGAAACDYTATAVFHAALEFSPDIMIVMLGSNDTTSPLWRGQTVFEQDYHALLDACADSGATLILCTCAAAYPVDGFYQFGVDPVALEITRDVIRKTAADRDLMLVDIALVTTDHPTWYQSDGVHPNGNGTAAIADAIAAALLA